MRANCLFTFIVISLLSGCASFRNGNIPRAQLTTANETLKAVRTIYVQETLKQNEFGNYCVMNHGCLWHGRKTFGDSLADQFKTLGVQSNFMGLSRQERISNLSYDEFNDGSLIYTGFKVQKNGSNFEIIPDVKEMTYIKIKDNPYRKKLEQNGVKKAQLEDNEYWIDVKIYDTSDSAGKWFSKSLVAGFSLTMLPIWQSIGTNIDISVSNNKNEILWHKNYSDSYTGMIWFLALPAIATASSVPDAINENIARVAVNDMVQSGIFKSK